MNQAHLTGLQLAIRASLAGTVAMAVAHLVSLPHPIYAFIGAIIVTDLSVAQSRQLGMRRMIATVIGAACGALLSPVMSSEIWGIGLGVLIAMLVSEAAKAHEGAKIAGYLCGLVLLEHRADPWHYALMRFAETALGVAVAWAISYVPKLIRIDDPPPR